MISLILGAITWGNTSYEVVKGKKSHACIQKAREIGERAQERYQLAVKEFNTNWEATLRLAAEYERLLLNVKMHAIGQFVDLIKQNMLQPASKQNLQLQTVLAEHFLSDNTKPVMARIAANQGVIGLTPQEVSSRTCISSSRFSTHSLVTRRRMALDSLVLDGVTVGSALTLGGFVLDLEEQEALMQARTYEAKVKAAIAKIEAAGDFLQQVARRLNQLADLVYYLNTYAIRGLSDLKSQLFHDDSKINSVWLAIEALGEIMKLPILDSQGKLNPATAKIQIQYHHLVNKSRYLYR